MNKDEEMALLHLARESDGAFSRCPECGSFMWYPFLKQKFDDVVQEGECICPVCILRERNKLLAR